MSSVAASKSQGKNSTNEIKGRDSTDNAMYHSYILCKSSLSAQKNTHTQQQLIHSTKCSIHYKVTDEMICEETIN